METNPPDNWLKLRWRTVFLFGIENILVGMDFSLTFLTLWMYLNTLIKPDDPLLYYSMISSAFLMASLTISWFVGRIVDDSRSIRKAFFMLNTIVIIGNIIYAIPTSPWMLFIGRFLSGFGGPLRSVIVGEVARSYHPDGLHRILSLMGFSYALGFVMGPAFNTIFENVRFSLFGVQITFVNMPGLVMASTFLLVQVISIFFLHDLSKIYDLKEELSKEKNEVNRVCGESSESLKLSHINCENQSSGELTSLLSTSGEKSTLSTAKSLFSHIDTTFLFILAFLQSYFALSFDIWTPLLIIKTMNWSVSSMNIIMLLVGFACVFPCVILAFVNVTNKQMFYMALVCVLSLAAMEMIFILLSVYNENIIVDYIAWGLYIVLFAFLTVMNEVFLTGCLAKMVSARIQTFSDSIRLTLYRLGALIALLTSPLIFKWIQIIGCIHIVIIFISFTCMIIRRKTLMNPKVIV